MKKLTTEEFIKKAITVHGDRYDYSLVVYVNYDTKVKIICPIHDIFEQTPDSHLQGRCCGKCGIKTATALRSSTKKNFIEKAITVHGDRYDYSLVVYINSQTKVKIICHIHDIFEQIPNHHLCGQGCSSCGDISSANKRALTTEEFIKKAITVHGDRYDYSLVVYVNSQTKVKIICHIHGIFEQVPNSHLRGAGCLFCNYTRPYSNIAIDFFKKIENFDIVSIQHAMNGGEYRIPGTRYTVDGYVDSYNLVIEFHGDYWHGNPQKYNTNHEAKSRYYKTKKREQFLLDKGYTVIAIWESEWNLIKDDDILIDTWVTTQMLKKKVNYEYTKI